jgi:hypothetical protein
MGISLLDLNNFGLYLNKTVMVIIIKISDLRLLPSGWPSNGKAP